jgi:hypothetical protein
MTARHARPVARRPSFRIVASLAIALACVVCYAGSLDGELVAGDIQFITENDAITRPSVLWTAFTHGYWWVGSGSDAGTYYRPLVVLLDAWDRLVWGGHAFGFHLTNTLLHVAASLLVFELARAWARSPAAALAAGLLFAVHPIHVHAVSYVSARSTVLCTAFYVGAVLAALRFRRAALLGRPGRGRALGAAFACTAGALLTMEAAATLPIVLAAVLWPPRERARAWRPELVRFAGATAALVAAYLVVRRLALGGVLSRKEDLWQLLAPVPTALTMAKTVGFYFEKLVVPTGLSYVPPFIPALDARDLAGWAWLVGLAALAILAAAGPRRLLAERAAVGWMLVTLAPVSGVAPLDHFVKGHYAYLPSVGFCVLVAMLLRRALRVASRGRARAAAPVVFGVGFATLLVGASVAALVANEAWAGPAALNERVLELEPEIPDALFPHPVMTRTANRFAFVHYNVAVVLAQENRCAEALPHAARARWLTRQRSIEARAAEVEARCRGALGARVR